MKPIDPSVSSPFEDATSGVSRRRFLAAGAVGISPLFGPRGRHRTEHREPRPTGPNDELAVACVGVGGMGWSDLGNVATGKNVRIVALCDVDANNLGRAAKAHADAKTFVDYRKMFDALAKDIDAVVVSTPDHMHGPIAVAAMELGKHVYCQKPIAHNLHECRLMATLAKKNKLVTQMGTQIHSHAAYRTFVATVQSGVLGRVQEAHCWVSRSWSGPANGRPIAEGGDPREDPVPDSLDWDLWLGVAPARPFVAKLYHPANWRGWLDFGSGTLGDMGCHIFDPVFSALGIGAPRKVVSRGPQHRAETFAPDSDILYEFAGSARTADTVSLRWTDGSKRSRPDANKAQLPDKVKLPGAGSFVVGEKGVLVLPHWAMPKFYKDGEAVDIELQKLPSKNHYHEWTDACRGEGETSTPFSYAGPLTEAVLLGTVAGRLPGETLTWDSQKLAFDNRQANEFVKRTYRKGRGL